MTPAVAAPSPTVRPLAGFTVAVTADRRAEELATLLQRRGARTVHAPALRIVPLADDTELLEVCRRLIEAPPDVVVATTGIGFRGWMEACETWGMAPQLRAALSGARLLARGPKAKGAIRQAGLVERWSPPSESSGEVLQHLLGEGVAGLRVAVQLHGEPLPDFCAALERAGAQVLQVPVYRWDPPQDTAPLDRLIESTLAGEVDAVTFTSAPAAAGLLARARALGRLEGVAAALRGEVLAMSVGPVTAGPLAEHGIPTAWPQRGRIGAQVNELCRRLPERHPVLEVAGHRLQVRGHAAVVDDTLVAMAPGPMRLLRALARAPGRVCDRSHLLAALGGQADGHAVETAVARLRSALGEPALVQTVVKRGYRLRVDA